MMASTACNARPSHSSFQRCNLYPRTSVNSSVRRTTCGVAGPLSPQEHTPRVPVLNFQPRVGRTDHGLEMQQPINVPQHHAMTPEPLYERLRKECHSGNSADAVLFTVMVICAQVGALSDHLSSLFNMLNLSIATCCCIYFTR